MKFCKKFIAPLVFIIFVTTYILTLTDFATISDRLHTLKSFATTNNVSVADDVYASANDHSPISISRGDSVAIRFRTNESFSSITIHCPSWNDNIGSLYFAMYEWQSGYTKTVRSTPVATQTFENFKDNDALTLSFAEVPAGNYMLAITNPNPTDNMVGVWYYPSEHDKIDFYRNGTLSKGSLHGYITTSSNNIENFFANKVSVDVNPGNWDAVDGLGRELSSDVSKRQEKFVGMFFWTWHDNFIASKPRIASKIVEQYPEAVNDFSHFAWENTPAGTPYFWDEPIFGFYKSSDKYVLRRQAELLADADIDVIIFDCTNGTYLWESAYTVLFEVFEEAKYDGIDVPQIAFMLNFSGNSNSKYQLIQLYDNIYSQNLYSDLWFYWEGKPLIMAHPEALDVSDYAISTEKYYAIKNFFTFRRNVGSYFSDDTYDSTDYWGWCANYPQTKHGIRYNGTVEQVTVSVAQNSTDTQLVAMNSPIEGIHGRSYTKDYYSYSFKKAGEIVTVDSDTENSMFYGLNFQQQWDYAISVDPDFIFVTGWNEWVAGRHEEWGGTINAFPDQFSPEYSRDIEPSSGVLKDYYYYQLVENVRRFKGTSSTNETVSKKSIKLSSGADAWHNISTSYDDYNDSEEGRNSNGYGDMYYTADAVRNDIVHSKFAYDSDNLYFMVQTENELTPYTDNNWMNLLLSIDGGGNNAWETFDFIINRTTPTSSKVTIEAFVNNSWTFTTVGTADYIIDGDTLVISIPKTLIGITGTNLPVINFKWIDGVDLNGDFMNLYGYGESAPNNRFTYRIDTAEGLEVVEDILGDVNGNAELDIQDAAIIYSGISGKRKLDDYQTIIADINTDGKINILDVMRVLLLI
ncbi:MAG: hypothetical protein E7384_00105 [Ruminococcaceae bacterium]|nr:hypothetical protein [Oscillospiraceae bacterium]